MFKSTNGLCSHCLLVATLNGEIDTFVQSHSKTKIPVNYTQLAQHGLPIGGKKPGSIHESLDIRAAKVKLITSMIRLFYSTKNMCFFRIHTLADGRCLGT